MKRSNQTPIFRNCPYADCFETQLGSDCRRCGMYERCVANKARKVKERKKAQARRRTFKFIMGLVLAIIVLGVASKAMSVEPKCVHAEEPNSYSEPKATAIPNATYVSTLTNIQPINQLVEENPQETAQSTPDMEEATQETVQPTPEVEAEPVVKEIIPVISAYQPGEVYYYILSNEAKKDMEKLIYKEARGEPYEGKVAVCAVVLNRFFSDDPRFNRESIHSIITQSGAFADISDVTQEMLDTVPDLKDAVEDACRGWDPTRVMFENGAMFFYAPKGVVGYQKQIREGIQFLQIGNHNFHNDFND